MFRAIVALQWTFEHRTFPEFSSQALPFRFRTLETCAPPRRDRRTAQEHLGFHQSTGYVNPGLINPVYGCLIGRVP